MNEQNKKMELLSSIPVSKALLSLGFPTMVGMMINALYNIVDAYFVGSLGTSQLGAVSVAFPLGQIVTGFALLFGNGSASYLSRLLGRKENKQADKVASTALYSSLFIGIIVIMCITILLHPILIFFGATESILPYAISYSRIIIVSSIFSVFNITMNNIVTSEGGAKTTMYALMAGAVLNIILDPLFIYSLNLGIAGAAIATAISQILSSVIYIVYICKKKSFFSFRFNKIDLSKNIILEIFKIGIPTLIFQLLTSISITLINMQANPYGDSVIAGMGTVTRIMSMGSLMVFGFIKGFQPIAGYSFGAQNYKRLRESIYMTILYSSIFCFLFGFIMFLFPEKIMCIFTDSDVKMIQIGSSSLRANGISFLFFGFYTVYSSLFLVLGKAKEGFLLGACRQGICFIPIILFSPMVLGINGVLYAQPISDFISALFALIMALYIHKQIIVKH